MTKAERLKQKGDIQGLVAILNNKRNWMLSLDAAEALVQLEDERGLNYLINALDNPNIDIREIAREILEGLDVPLGNTALELHPQDSIYSSSDGYTGWKIRLKQIGDVLASQKKRTIWNFSLEWLAAHIAGYLLSAILFVIFLNLIFFLEEFKSTFITKSILTDVHTTWVFKKTVLDISKSLSDLRDFLIIPTSLVFDGVLIGLAQQFILKRYDFQIKSWALAAICGWTLGIIISQEASWYIASLLIDMRGSHWELGNILGYTLSGCFFGAVIGLSQGFVLRRKFNQRIASWLLFNIIVWGFSYFFSEIIVDKIFWEIVGYPIGFGESDSFLNYHVLQISKMTIGGTVTGILLFRKSQQPTI